MRYQGIPVQIWKRHHTNGCLRIDLIDESDGSPYATCTIMMEDLAKDEVAIKNYSENAGMLAFLLDEDLIEYPHRFINQGYVTIPICKIKKSLTTTE